MSVEQTEPVVNPTGERRVLKQGKGAAVSRNSLLASRGNELSKVPAASAVRPAALETVR